VTSLAKRDKKGQEGAGTLLPWAQIYADPFRQSVNFGPAIRGFKESWIKEEIC
jgi:hypothetical protein